MRTTFTLLVIIVYVIQPDTAFDSDKAFNEQFTASGETVSEDAGTAAEIEVADNGGEDASASAEAAE